MRGWILKILLCVALFSPILSVSCEVNMENNGSVSTNSPTVWTKVPFPELEFHNDYPTGTTDINGNFMGGTECLFLVGHKGMLFAGIGYWNDIPGDDLALGAQVLRKETANGHWIVEKSWDTNYLRVNAMESVTFTTDGNGKKLKKPVNLLVASPGSQNPSSSGQQITVWVRNDVDQTWEEGYVVTRTNATLAYARAISQVYRDKVTGVDYIFSGVSETEGNGNGGVYRGVYDASVTGSIRWDTTPEFEGRGRWAAFTEVNGRLYASQGQAIGNQNSGGVYVRTDGLEPKWELVYRLPMDSAVFKYSLMRGIEAVNDPLGSNNQVLIGVWDQSGCMAQRIDPMNNNAVTTELDIKPYLIENWGGLFAPTQSLFAAYNHITPVKHPLTGETVHLFGLMAWHPDPEIRLSSWYFIRYQDGSYDLGRIWAPDYIMPEVMKTVVSSGLRAARTIVVSPFVEDKGKVFYMGGYDSWTTGHNTAWIFKGTVKP